MNNQFQEFIKKQVEKVSKLLPYKIDVEVNETDKADEVEVVLVKHYKKPLKKITIDCVVKERS